jgi:DNA-binding transcriptional ArsR family regulator
MDSETEFFEMVDFFKVLGEPTRLRMINMLSEGPLTLDQIVKELGTAVGLVSHHLARLAAGGLVTVQDEEGCYRLCTEKLSSMSRKLQATADAGRQVSSFHRDMRDVMVGKASAEGGSKHPT